MDSERLINAYEEHRLNMEKKADDFWNGLSYEDKCNAFHAVISRIFEGEIKVKGSYRYVLYEVFNFGPDMYSRGMDCGFMALHNSIMTDDQFNEANAWMADDNPL